MARGEGEKKNPLLHVVPDFVGTTRNRGHMEAGRANSLTVFSLVFTIVFPPWKSRTNQPRPHGFTKKRLIPIPFGSITCIRFNGYNLSLSPLNNGDGHPP